VPAFLAASVIGAFYYLKFMISMFFDEPAEAYEARGGAVEKLAEPKRRSRNVKGAGLSAGRRKNVYRITEDGERLFAQLVESPDPGTDDNSFRVRLAFFRHLKPETRIGVMERRRAILTERLKDLKERFVAYREAVDSYTLSLMRHGMDTTEHDIRWLDDMIMAERRTTDSGPRPRRTRKSGVAKRARPRSVKERKGVTS
jgi:DNA-binding PadR family transcriptional regulator